MSIVVVAVAVEVVEVDVVAVAVPVAVAVVVVLVGMSHALPALTPPTYVDSYNITLEHGMI